MLNDATGFQKIFLACGYTDLRYGIDGLSTMIKNHFGLDPFQPGTIFLFCGRRTDRIKALVWEEDGFLLLYKRLEARRFQWPRTEDEIKSITWEQYHWLMSGMKIEQKKSISKTSPLLPG